jgi:hypothetical protein
MRFDISSLRKSQWAPYLFLLMACLIGYWPLSFGLFSAKNDAIRYFLPFRYNISSAIQSGELPFWSPFVHLGYPLHGDMQSGAWNPFVLFISFFTTYNLTVFHIEMLLYVYISGYSFYKLSGLFSNTNSIRLLVASSYMLSGYMFSSAQFINWLASAAFLPLVLFYYYSLLQSGKRKYAVGTSVSAWLLLVCGYPADFIYVVYILLAMLGVAAYREWRNKRMIAKHQLILHIVAVALFLGLSAPALFSYIELLPFYQRGEGATITEAFENSYQPRNLISLLNPWPTWAIDFTTTTNPTGRNLFIGLIPLCLAGEALRLRNFKTYFLSLLLLFSLSFAFGEGFFVRQFAYDFLPGMGSFRHPSHFRLYVIAAILLLGCIAAERMVRAEAEKRLKPWLIASGIVSLSILVLQGITSNTHTLFSLSSFDPTALKLWLNSITKEQALLWGLCIQLLFILALSLLLHLKKGWHSIAALHVISLLVFNALLPVMLVSKTKPATINALLLQQPQVPDVDMLAKQVQENSQGAARHYNDIGYTLYYNKKIGLSPEIYSPSAFSSLQELVNQPFLYNQLMNQPVAYLADVFLPFTDTARVVAEPHCRFIFSENIAHKYEHATCAAQSQKLVPIGLHYNAFHFKVETSDTVWLHLNQNHYPHWQATVDGKKATIERSNYTFMAVQIPPGKHQVRWEYKPIILYFLLTLSLVTIAFCILLYSKKAT